MRLKKTLSVLICIALIFCMGSCSVIPENVQPQREQTSSEGTLPVVYMGSSLEATNTNTPPKVLTGGKWYTENMFNNNTIEAQAEHGDAYSTVTLKSGSYSLTRIVSKVGAVKSGYYYDISVDVQKNNSDTDVDILEIWYTSSGTELQRQYVDSERASLSPNGAARLDVYVLVRGFDADTVKVSLPTVTEIKPYEKREAKLAAVTLQSVGQKTMQDNLNQALDKIDMLCEDPATKPDLIVFTERFHTMHLGFSKFYDSYLKLDSDYIKTLQAKAKEKSIYLSFSFREIDDDGNCYNSAPLIDRNGEIVLNYHKSHLTMGELARGLVPGKELMYYDTDFGRVGMAICWDLFFNDCTDSLAKMGVELIINPSLGYWDDINSMRAEDTGAYILTCGQSNSGTAILRPEGNYNSDKVQDYGNIIDRGDWGNNDGIVEATVDLAQVFPVKYLSAPSTATRPNVYEFESRPDLYEKYKWGE